MSELSATHQASLVVRSACELGEGPLYDVNADVVWWLDIRQHRLHGWSPSTGDHQVHELPRRVSYVGRTSTGTWIVAGDGGVHLAQALDAPWQLLASLPISDDVVTNDGCIDPHGRLWIGTADLNPPQTRGQLLIVDAEGRAQPVRSDVSMSNGVGFSPDGRSAYHVDTRRHTLFELQLDDAGVVLRERELAHFTTMPDGIAVDVDGGIWVAQWDGAVVERRRSDGTLDDIVSVDGGWITSCAFGDGTALYITSAAADLADPVAPGAGGLFVADVGRRGVEISTFGG